MSPPPEHHTIRAYSYLRFSTPEQRKGDSARRQSQMALEYAQRYGLELDSELTFADLGVSAFRGQNAEAGRLADFLEAVRSGLVPRGSFLLVEQLDRLSRLAPRKALRVLEDIVDEGITVVTLNDGRRFTSASLDEDHTDLMVAILTFVRANEESRTKSRRLKASWEGKRAAIGERPLTRRVPAWLTYHSEQGKFVLISGRSALINRIFQMTAAGAGQHKIAETFNREGIRPWGNGSHWQRSYISKILHNPAVAGTFTPQTLEYDGNRRVRRPLDPIEGYFPRAVEEPLWSDVQAMLASGRAVARGRHVGCSTRNILAGLATCPHCGGTFTRVSKGPKSSPYLVCARAKAGAGCKYRATPYGPIEDALVQRLSERLNSVPAGAGGEQAERDFARLEEEIDFARMAAKEKAAALSLSRSRTIAAELQALENHIDQLVLARNDAVERRYSYSGPLVQSRVERLREALAKTPTDRDDVNTKLRAVFRAVVINYPRGLLELQWGHADEDCCIPFALPADE